MRRPLFAGNWKMYKTLPEGIALVRGLVTALKGSDRGDVVVCPPAPLLTPLAEELKGSAIALGAQNVYFEDEGAFTGEWSCAMLKSVGATYAIIGHSERRTIFGETDGMVQKKTAKALKAGLVPIMCVGETLKEREEGETFAVLLRHVRAGLAGIPENLAAKVIIAYEPVWAIGTGKTATPAQGQEVHAFIRKEVARLYGGGLADAMRILYGGSVKPSNVKELVAQNDIDGALVGGASLKVEDFAAIARGGA